MKKIPYNTTEKYINTKFTPGGTSKEDGFNCLSMCLDFCKNELDMQFEFGEKITGDITWKNLVELFKANPKKIFNEVEKHFLKHYEIIPPHQMRKGDLITIDDGGDRKVPCVFAGNNKILITTTKGVKVKSLKSIRITNAYRLREPKKVITKAVYRMGENPEDFELLDEESYGYDGDIDECEAATWIAAIGLIISLVTAVWAYYNQPDTLGKIDIGTQLNTRTTKEPLRVVYGVQRVAGNDVYISSMGDYHKYLYIIFNHYYKLHYGEVQY